MWVTYGPRFLTTEPSYITPIGLEVHGSAHAFIHPGFIGEATFYQYNLINKNDAPLTEAFFGFFVDPDLGSFEDDYVGSDTLLHMGFVYNADNQDDQYGAAPPALGFTFLKSALADTDGIDNDYDGFTDEQGEMLGMHSFTTNDGDGGAWGDAIKISDFYRYYQGLWKDGEPILVGDFGRSDFFPEHLPRKTTRYHFSGDPVTGEFWSQLNVDNQGMAWPDMQNPYIMATGPFQLNPGDTLTVAFAIAWARGADYLDSITALRNVVQNIREEREAFLAPVNVQPVALRQEPGAPLLDFDQNYPNPFTDRTQLEYSLPKRMSVRLVIYDVLGREVEQLVDADQGAGSYSVPFDGSGLPPGVYYARIELDYLRFTQRMVKTP